MLEFVDVHGLPVAIKAAFGGGGRGLKVARTREEIPELFDSATREAIAAFGRGECFVEKYLDQPRHVETQCLADAAGNVVVISTRDCSLQRRHQKLVEEAPAPFLTEEQTTLLYESSKAILREVGYLGAGTCEFLIGKDGTVSFLEVNTRLQVEHPVSEEVTGIDLVREQFRIAEGGLIDYDDPETKGHSIEFRINGEDPGRNFLPTPGPVHVLRFPGGPGVRVDSGVTTGDVISGAFDSLLAKLIVTGTSREDALEKSPPRPRRVRGRRTSDRAAVPSQDRARPGLHRARRQVRGLHALDRDRVRQRPRAVGRDAARRCRSGEARTRWSSRSTASASRSPCRTSCCPREPPRHPPPPRRRGGGGAVVTATGNAVKAPMQATVVKVAVEEGQKVVKGDLVLVLEAMKMEQPLTAHKDGTVGPINATVGATVSAGHLLLTLAD